MRSHFFHRARAAAELAVVAGFDQFVDERRDDGEADALVLAAGFDTECGHQVYLAGAGVAEEDDRLGAIQITAVGKRTHLGGEDAGGVDIEVFQGLDLGQFASESRLAILRCCRSSTSAASRALR